MLSLLLNTLKYSNIVSVAFIQVFSQQFDPVELEIIQQEISRMIGTFYVQVNGNSRACYDCIIPEVAIAINKKSDMEWQQNYPDLESYLSISKQIPMALLDSIPNHVNAAQHTQTQKTIRTMGGKGN